MDNFEPTVAQYQSLQFRLLELESKKDDALDALRELHDEQNGPPLLTREKQWQVAMGKAEKILRECGK